MEYIQQGLRIDPDNEELIELRETINN